MGVLRKQLLKSGRKNSLARVTGSLSIDQDELDMRRDIEEQRQAAMALQIYVDEVVAGFEKLLFAQLKLREGAMKELQEVGRAMDAPLTSFGRAVRHMKEIASQTRVTLQVHQLKLSTCCTELARRDKAVAMLQSMGIALQADKDSYDCHADSKVLATISKGRGRQKTLMEGEQLAKIIHDVKVLQACARLKLETCVTSRESLVALARTSLEAVATTVPQVDQTVEDGVLDKTLRSNSPVISYMSNSTCNEHWNPFAPDLMEGLDEGIKGNDSMLLKCQMSDSTSQTTVGSSISQHDSGTSSINPFMTSDSPEEECADNPFMAGMSSLHVRTSMTSQPLETPSKHHRAEEEANNPFTKDLAQAADEGIPDEVCVGRPPGLTLSATRVHVRNMPLHKFCNI